MVDLGDTLRVHLWMSVCYVVCVCSKLNSSVWSYIFKITSETYDNKNFLCIKGSVLYEFTFNIITVMCMYVA